MSCQAWEDDFYILWCDVVSTFQKGMSTTCPEQVQARARGQAGFEPTVIPGLFQQGLDIIQKVVAYVYSFAVLLQCFDVL